MRVYREIDKRYLLTKLSEYDIYAMYYPYKFKLNKVCLNPFKQEKNPSFIIGNKIGRFYHKSFNSEHKGNCFDFVKDMFHLQYYSDVFKKIAKDFGLLEKDDTEYQRVISTIDRPAFIEIEPLHIQAVPKPFTDQHIDYLKRGFLEPQDLNISKDTKAFAVSSLYINKVRQYLPSDEICYGYNLKNERGDWMKIYRPFAAKKDKWRTNIPFYEMHGLDNIKSCKQSIVAKSVKDTAFLRKYIMPHVATTQAEDISAFSPENIEYIDKNSERNYVSWDSDEKGVKACIEVTEQTGWGYINPPKELLQYGVTDWFEMAEFYKSPQAVQDFFVKKKIL